MSDSLADETTIVETPETTTTTQETDILSTNENKAEEQSDPEDVALKGNVTEDISKVEKTISEEDDCKEAVVESEAVKCNLDETVPCDTLDTSKKGEAEDENETTVSMKKQNPEEQSELDDIALKVNETKDISKVEKTISKEDDCKEAVVESEAVKCNLDETVPCGRLDTSKDAEAVDENETTVFMKKEKPEKQSEHGDVALKVNECEDTCKLDKTISKEVVVESEVVKCNLDATVPCDTLDTSKKAEAGDKKETTVSMTKVEPEDATKISQSTQDKVINSEQNAQSVLANDEHVAKTTSENTSTLSAAASSSIPSKDDHADDVTYTDDGSAIYTDPKTKYQYKWCTKSNNWTPCEAQTDSSTNPYENEHYKWCQETQKWIPKQSQVTETEHYKWDAVQQQWLPKKKDAAQSQTADIVYDIDEDGQRIYTDKEGTVYFWDVEKKAWFPKLDEDFMARYQMNYGFIDNTSAAAEEKQKLEEKAAVLKEKELEQMTEEAKCNDEADKTGGVAGTKRKAQQEPPKWFDIEPELNTKVYVSNLPLDITLDEFTEVMSKCGMIMRDAKTQKFKLKLYTEADGQIKGDGLCDYIKVESVDLALNILDGYDLRNHKLRVQQAQFQMRGEYNPALKPKRKKKDKEKLAKIKEKLFDWRPEKMRGERSKNEKTVIIKNLFHPDLFEKEVQLILDYQNDLREECAKCGSVRKVVIYDRHLEGVAQINMASPEEADLVIQMMQGRFFGKRQLTAEHWDGKTKYKIEETAEEIQKRLNKWDSYLETDEQKSEMHRAEASKADDCPEALSNENNEDLQETKQDIVT